MKTHLSFYPLIREATLNLSSSPLRTMLGMLAAAAVGAAVTLSTIANVDNIERAHRAQELRGISTLSVTATGGGVLSASACDSVNLIDTVRSAGGMLRTEHVPLSNSDTQLAIRYVTPGFIPVVFPDSAVRGSSTVAGGDLSRELGLVPGAALLTADPSATGEVFRTEAIASDRSRIDGVNRDLFVATAPVGDVAECLVEVSGGQADTVATALPAIFSTSIAIRPFLPADRVDRNPSLELDSRWSGPLWLWGGGGILLFMTYIWWSRRHETALYRLIGFSTRAIATIVALETTLIAIVPAQLASFTVLALAPPRGGLVSLNAVAADSSRLLLVLIISVVCSAAISLTGSTVNRLKGQ